jgi:hypothetical protein
MLKILYKGEEKEERKKPKFESKCFYLLRKTIFYIKYFLVGKNQQQQNPNPYIECFHWQT